MAPASRREEIPRGRSKTPGGGGGKGGGKDKGKGKNGGGRGSSRPPGVKLFCKDFFETGTCNNPNCKGPHHGADAVAEIKKSNPRVKDNGWLDPPPADDKSGGKGKGKKK